MSVTSTALIVALISAAVSLATALGVERSRRRSSVALAQFEDELARRREAEGKKSQADRLVSRYRDPLLLSAFDLQSRLYNILRPGGFIGRRHPEYMQLNTLFLVAQFFAWLEILRLDMQFLDLGEIEETALLSQRLSRVTDIFASTSRYQDDFYIYRGEQRAMGELLVITRAVATEQSRLECMGYAGFVGHYDNPAFAAWFERFRLAIATLPSSRADRLRDIQNALIDLIEFLDPSTTRFVGSRERIVRSATSN